MTMQRGRRSFHVACDTQVDEEDNTYGHAVGNWHEISEHRYVIKFDETVMFSWVVDKIDHAIDGD
jgi:hypothetical protein